MTPAPDYFRLSEAPQKFSVSADTIRRWAEAAPFGIYKRGNISLVKYADVVAYIEGGPSAP